MKFTMNGNLLCAAFNRFSFVRYEYIIPDKLLQVKRPAQRTVGFIFFVCCDFVKKARKRGTGVAAWLLIGDDACDILFIGKIYYRSKNGVDKMKKKDRTKGKSLMCGLCVISA